MHLGDLMRFWVRPPTRVLDCDPRRGAEAPRWHKLARWRVSRTRTARGRRGHGGAAPCPLPTRAHVAHEWRTGLHRSATPAAIRSLRRAMRFHERLEVRERRIVVPEGTALVGLSRPRVFA